MLPESPLSRPVPLSIGTDQRVDLAIETSSDERAAVAAWLEIEACPSLAATVSVAPVGDGFRCQGWVRVDLVMQCVVTGDPVPAHVEFAVDRMLRIGEEPVADGDEPETFDPGEEDVDWLAEPVVDVGRIVAEEVSLNLPLAPRSADADTVMQQVNPDDDEASGPFAQLARLRTDA